MICPPPAAPEGVYVHAMPGLLHDTATVSGIMYCSCRHAFAMVEHIKVHLMLDLLMQHINSIHYHPTRHGHMDSG